MKKFALFAALVLAAGILSAQDAPPPPPGLPPGPGREGPGMMGPARVPPIDWKIGMVVTIEYKSVTGTVTLDPKMPPALTVNGTEFRLMIPRKFLENLKSGDSLTVEGPVATAVGAPNFRPFIEAFKVVVDGKLVEVRHPRPDDNGGMQPPPPQQ